MIPSSRCIDYLVSLQYSPPGDLRRSPSAILSGENRHGEIRGRGLLPGRSRVQRQSLARRCPNELGEACTLHVFSWALGPGHC